MKELQTKEGIPYDTLVGNQFNLFSLVNGILPSLSRTKLVSYILPSSDSATTYSLGAVSYTQDLIIDNKINTESKLYTQFRKIVMYDVQNAAISVSKMFDVVDGKLVTKAKYLDATPIPNTDYTEGSLQMATLHNIMEDTLAIDSRGVPKARAFEFRNFANLLDTILASNPDFSKSPLVMESIVDSILPDYVESFAINLIDGNS